MADETSTRELAEGERGPRRVNWPALHPKVRRVLSWGVLAALLWLTYVTRVYNAEDTYYQPDKQIYFVEGDCYSRMTRARMVDEGQWVIRHHDFENFPQGTTPHTTALMDWMIVGLKKLVHLTAGLWDRTGQSPYRQQELDVAGTLISPLLGLMTAWWLWWWAGRLRLPFRALMVAFFAVSSILVDGTLLGRPDHQSLLMFLLAVAVCSEFALADAGTPAKLARRWAAGAGLAWGLALWVSLYEPLVFFAGAMGRHFLFQRGALFARPVWGRWLVLGGVIVAALCIDGWRMTWPDATLLHYFKGWSSTILELRHLDLRGSMIWNWTGFFGAGAFLLLALAAQTDRRAWSLLLLVGGMLVLCLWQVRWGYFLGLAVAISIPWQLGALRSRSWGWVVGLIALVWPARDSWNHWHPTEAQEKARLGHDVAQAYWRRLAEYMRNPERRPFLAPWWVCPQLAYWSGQPGVAGTSHQSLPGIVDTANLYLAFDLEEVKEILRRREVRYLLVDDVQVPESEELAVIFYAEKTLGVRAPEDPFGEKLVRSPNKAPKFLRHLTADERGLVYTMADPTKPDLEQKPKFYLPQYLHLFTVDQSQL